MLYNWGHTYSMYVNMNPLKISWRYICCASMCCGSRSFRASIHLCAVCATKADFFFNKSYNLVGLTINLWLMICRRMALLRLLRPERTLWMGSQRAEDTGSLLICQPIGTRGPREKFHQKSKKPGLRRRRWRLKGSCSSEWRKPRYVFLQTCHD